MLNKEISPKQKGLNTELHCISYFSDCGFLVSTPYGDNGRYDLIVDVNGHLLRIQAKTCSLIYDSEGEASGIKFSCRSARINTRESYVRRYTKDEIDYFATYWNHKVYVIPVEEASTEKILHFFEPKNNQGYKMSFLEDYTIEKQWNKYFINNNNQNNGLKIEEPKINNVFIDYKKSIPKTKIEYKCQRCGIKITKGSTYCDKCAHYLSRKVERPDRETLKKEIRTIPFTQLSKKYNVSDKAIVKWCIAENLPSKKSEIKAIPDNVWEKL